MRLGAEAGSGGGSLVLPRDAIPSSFLRASFPSLEAAVSPSGSPLCLAEPWRPGLGMPARSA